MATQERVLTPAELWLLELERERWDRSYLTPSKPSYEPTVIQVTKVAKGPTPAQQRARDQVMFHAGRYAQGARDTEATEANAKVGKLISKGTK